MATGQIKIPYTPNPKQDEIFSSYRRRRGRPILFQVISPNSRRPLLPFLLALHVNPESLEERFSKSKNVVQTYGGYVEFIWPDDLDSLSASGTTGAFLNPEHGLTTEMRHNTIAWERQQDLLELFHHNGMIFDGNGLTVLRGTVQMIYDRGIYEGFFTTFTVTEDDEHPFSFNLDWEFKVEVTTYKFPPNVLQNVEIATPVDSVEPFIPEPEGANFLPISYTQEQQAASSQTIPETGDPGTGEPAVLPNSDTPIAKPDETAPSVPQVPPAPAVVKPGSGTVKTKKGPPADGISFRPQITLIPAEGETIISLKPPPLEFVTELPEEIITPGSDTVLK